MAVIETKYSVGDKVWYAGVTTEARQHPCPDCKGERKWQAVSPAGYEYTFACPRCATSFASHDELSLKYTAHIPALRQLTIGSVRHDSNSGPFADRHPNTYMCVETGVGGGAVYYESDLFETEEAARIAAAAKATKADREIKHIAERYNRSLEVSDYQLESALLREAKEARSRAHGLLWNLNNLFASIEEAADKEAILEAVEDYKRWTWQRDKAAATPPPASPPASPEANTTTSVDGDGAGEGRGR